jgi:hypothetical protein
MYLIIKRNVVIKATSWLLLIPSGEAMGIQYPCRNTILLQLLNHYQMSHPNYQKISVLDMLSGFEGSTPNSDCQLKCNHHSFLDNIPRSVSFMLNKKEKKYCSGRVTSWHSWVFRYMYLIIKRNVVIKATSWLLLIPSGFSSICIYQCVCLSLFVCVCVSLLLSIILVFRFLLTRSKEQTNEGTYRQLIDRYILSWIKRI